MKDPIVEEVRKARLEHAKEFNHDLSAICKDLKRIERECLHHEFLVNDITVHVVPKVTLSDYNKNLTPDNASYLKAIYHRHCQPKLN